MATERRLIDANAVMEELSSLTVMVTGLRAGKGVLAQYAKEFRESVLRIVDEQPTVDAVEVVRCKDCKHFVQGEPYDPCECMKWTLKFGVAYTEPDGFCSYGERRTDNG